MVQELTETLPTLHPAEVAEDRTAEEQGQLFARYKEIGGILPQGIFEGAMTLLQSTHPESFSEDEKKANTHLAMLAQGYARAAHITITPKIETLYSILIANKGDVLRQPGERKPFPLGGDQPTMAQALLMAGEYSKYRTFIHHFSIACKDDLDRERRPRPTSQAA